MSELIKTVYQGGVGELIEKKSRFIATVMPCESEEAALVFIDSLKKKYWDARHNCSAYTIGMRHEITHCSDDGEPAKTAGRPMLDVLLNEDIHNVCVVVTRYFGGILLGTGGLVRAYQGAVKEGLANSILIEKQFGIRLRVTTDYNSIGKLQYLFASEDYAVLSTEYTDAVAVRILVSPERLPALTEKITEVTSGSAGIEEEKRLWFSRNGKDVLLFE